MNENVLFSSLTPTCFFLQFELEACQKALSNKCKESQEYIMQILNLKDKIENQNNEIQKSVKENEPKVKEDIKKLTKEIIALKEEISLKNDENIEIVTEKTKMNNLLDTLNRKIHNLEKENMSLRSSMLTGK